MLMVFEFDPFLCMACGPRRGSRPRWLAGLCLLWVLFVGSACATPPPIDLTSSRPRVQPPLQETGTPEDREQARRESESLRVARAVLEQKGSRKLDAAQREAIAHALVRAEREHGLSVIVSLAMIDLESRFDPHARGPAGSIGLMQLQPATARAVAQRHGLPWRSERTLLDPLANAQLGLAYLAELNKRFGNTDHAIGAYNIGPANMHRLLAKRPLRHGPYLTKVYSRIDALRQTYGVSHPGTAGGSEPNPSEHSGNGP